MGTQNQTLKLVIDYDGKDLTAGLKTASGEMVTFGRKGSAATTKTRAGLQSISTQLDHTKKQIISAGAAWASWESARIIKGVIDEQTNLRTAISRTIESQDQFNYRQLTLLDLANRTRSQMGETVNLFLKLREPMQAVGHDTEATLQFIELFQKSLKKYPTTVLQAASSTQQLAQAIGSNNFAGDEFSSLSENAQGFMESLRDGIEEISGASNLTIADLKKMAAEGKLTTDLVVTALATQKAKIDEVMNGAEKTIDDAFVRIKNNISTAIGNADAEAGFSKAFAESLITVADNLDVVGNVAAATFALIVARSADAATKRVAHKAREIAADRAAAAATIAANLQTIKSENAKAAAFLKTARDKQLAAATNLRLIKQQQAAQLNAGIVTNKYAEAKTRLTAANAALASAEAKATATTTALSGAQSRAALTTRAMTAASAGLKGTMALLGGPVGLFALAAMGLYSYRGEIREALFETQQLDKAQSDHLSSLEKVKNLTKEAASASRERTKAIKQESRAELELARIEFERAKQSLDEQQIDIDSNKSKDRNDPNKLGALAVQEQLGKLGRLKEVAQQRGATFAKLAQLHSNLETEIQKISEKKGGEEAARKHAAALKRQADEIKKSINHQSRYNEKIKQLKALLAGGYLTQEEYNKAKAAELNILNRAEKKYTVTAKGISNVQRAIKNEVAALKDKIAQLTLTDEAYERSRLKSIGFKGAQLEEQVELWKTKEALESKAQQLEKNKRKQEELKKTYNDLRESNALQLSLLKLTGNEYLEASINATKYSDAQKAVLLNEAIAKRNAEKRKEIKDSAKSRNLELDYQINVHDGNLNTEQQQRALDKVKVAFERAKLETQGYSAAIVDLQGRELTAIQIKERLAEKQKTVADIIRQSNTELLHHTKLKELGNQKYQEWLLTQQGVDKATAELIVKRKQSIELEKEFADVINNEVKTSLEKFIDTGNSALDSLIAKFAEAILAGKDLSSVFGAAGGGASSSSLGGLVNVVAGLFTGGSSFSVGGGAQTASLQGATYAGAFNTGGRFKVGGKGGIDNNRVIMDLSRDEEVEIKTLEQQRRSAITPSSANVSFKPTIIINAPEGSNVEGANVTEDNDGNFRIDLLEKRIEANMARNVNNGNSPLTPALAKKLRVS